MTAYARARRSPAFSDARSRRSPATISPPRSSSSTSCGRRKRCRSCSRSGPWPTPPAPRCRSSRSVRPTTVPRWCSFWRRRRRSESFPAHLPARGREADGGRDGEPVGVFAVDVTAVNEVDGKYIDRPPTQAGLKPRLRDRGYRLGGAGLTEYLRGEGVDVVGGSPIDSEAVGQVVAIENAVPLPAAVDVDPHHLREPQCGRNVDVDRRVLVRDQVVKRLPGNGQAEGSDRARDDLGLRLGCDAGGPFVIRTRTIDLRAELDRPAHIHHA